MLQRYTLNQLQDKDTEDIFAHPVSEEEVGISSTGRTYRQAEIQGFTLGSQFFQSLFFFFY